AVGLDDGPADGQSHAKPVALGGIKWLKDLIELVPAQARSTVTHRHLCHASALLLRLQHNSTLVNRTVLHRVKRIEQQIEDDLLQLYPVALHCRQVWKFEIEIDVEQGGVAVDQASNIADDLREVEGDKRDCFLFYQRPHPLDDLAGTTVVLDNVFENLLHFLQIRRIGDHEALSRLRVAQNGGER